MKEPVRRLGQFGYNVGKFAVENHSTLAPLLHGVAVASGHTGAQKVTGGLLALSNAVSTKQGLNNQNNPVKSEMGKGGYRVYDVGAGRMSQYR